MSEERRQPPASDQAAINPGTEDSDSDTNSAVEDSAAAFAVLMQTFMASMTDAIVTAITTASKNAANIAVAEAKAARTLPKAVALISLSIDPFDNLSMDMNTR